VACAMLARLGYAVRTAVDGREAVSVLAQAMAQGEPIAAVLMDLNMPDVDGLEATRQLQAAWGAAAPPVIAVTAAASAEDRARCQAAGMQDYLTKPLQVAALAQALEKWIRDAPHPAVPDASPLPAQETPLMDYARLREFREFDDEELSMTREVVALFIADTPARLQAMEVAAAQGDAAGLARAAHALKGAAGNVGAAALHEAAGQLEQRASLAWPPDAGERIAQLQRLWVLTQEALADWQFRT